MATVNKSFRVKNGLVVEGSATDILVGSDTLPEVIQDTIGAMVTGNTESGIAVTYDDTGAKLNFSVTDTNTTYSVSAESTTGGSNLRLTGSDSSTDDVAILGSGATTVTRTDANTITISSTDTNTVTNAFTTLSVSGQSDVVADSTSDTLTLAGSGVTITTNAGTDTITFTNAGVTSIAGTTNEIEVSASTGSVTVGLPDNVTIGGTLTVTGDLTVNGTTTTLNTDTLAVEDNIVVLNSNVTGTPSLDAGIEVERGSYTNAKIYWKESANAWYLSTPGDDSNAATDAAITTGGSINMFGTVSDGSNTATPDSSNDTLTFAAGTGLTATVNGTTDTVTYSLDSSATASVLSVTLPNSKIEDGTVTSSGTSVDIDTFTLANYKSAKYVVQMTNSGGDAHLVEVLVTAVGTSAYIVEYGELITNSSLGDVSADSDGTTVTVSVGSTSSGVVVKHSVTYIEA